MNRKALPHIAAGLAAAVTLLLDQITKHLVISSLGLYESVSVAGDWFRLTRVHNYGVSFGLLNARQAQPALVLFALAALGFLAWMYRRPSTTDPERFAIGLITGGAVGNNLIDRVRFGYVVDFIDIGLGRWRFFTFNIADTAITVGIGLLLLAALREERRLKDRPQEPPHAP